MMIRMLILIAAIGGCKTGADLEGVNSTLLQQQPGGESLELVEQYTKIKVGGFLNSLEARLYAPKAESIKATLIISTAIASKSS